MSFTDAPANVTALRDALIATSTAISIGLASGRVHFPTLAFPDITTSDFPLALIGEGEASFVRSGYAESREDTTVLTVQIYALSSTSIGTLHGYARSIAAQLCEWETGLAISRATAGIVSDLRQGREAAAEDTGANAIPQDVDDPAKWAYRTVQITVEYEG